MSGVNHIFVYGTLMDWPLGTNLGPKQLPGYQLHNLGWYPGIVPTDDLSSVVHGVVFEFDDYSPSLDRLDSYEGCIAPGDAANLFDRQVVNIEGIEAYVYVYNHKPTTEPIASGRWVAP